MTSALVDLFRKEGQQLYIGILQGKISMADVAATLDLIYSAGVLDSANYNAEQKTIMHAAIKDVMAQARFKSLH